MGNDDEGPLLSFVFSMLLVALFLLSASFALVTGELMRPTLTDSLESPLLLLFTSLTDECSEN